MTPYSFGDVLLVPFPFTDQTATKKRPTVVISSNLYNLQKADLIVMAITSQIKQPLPLGELRIIEWSAAGLLKASVIKPIVTSLEKSLVDKCLGQLQEVDQQALMALLPRIIGNSTSEVFHE